MTLSTHPRIASGIIQRLILTALREDTTLPGYSRTSVSYGVDLRTGGSHSKAATELEGNNKVNWKRSRGANLPWYPEGGLRPKSEAAFFQRSLLRLK